MNMLSPMKLRKTLAFELTWGAAPEGENDKSPPTIFDQHFSAFDDHLYVDPNSKEYGHCHENETLADDIDCVVNIFWVCEIRDPAWRRLSRWNKTDCAVVHALITSLDCADQVA